MKLPDVNVMIYAFRADSENHPVYKEWLESVVYARGPFAMSTQVLASVIRICTHPRIFVNPTPAAHAVAFADALLDRPNCRVIQPGEDHWGIFADLCANSRPTGNLVQDAWFAALAIESGCEWITTDGDYARFKGLNWKAPF